MSSKLTLFVLPMLLALASTSCGDVEIAKTGDGSDAGAAAGVGGASAGSGGTNQAGAKSAGGSTAGLGGTDNGAQAGAGGASCELEATHTLGNTKSAVTVGQYCDVWYVCFASAEDATAAAAAHPSLDCQSHSQGCDSSCQFNLQARALSAAELEQLCGISSESSIGLICTNFE